MGESLTNKIRNGLVGSSTVAGLLCKGNNLDLLREYGADTLFTFGAYHLLRKLGLNERDALVAPLIATYAGEILQGLGIQKGWYDPLDFLAYGLGAFGAIGLEKILKKQDKQVLLSN